MSEDASQFGLLVVLLQSDVSVIDLWHIGISKVMTPADQGYSHY